jgi:Polyketide cyclase / dehydrase and lipid transport
MKLSGEVLIEASADAVWEIIGRRFADIGNWATAVEASYAEPGARAGRVCRTGLRAFPTVTERIIALDDSVRTLRYEATGLPRFVGEAHNRWQVTAAGPDRARARFDGVLRMRGPLGRLVALPIHLRMLRETRTVLDDLKYYAEHGTPSARKRRQRLRARRRPTGQTIETERGEVHLADGAGRRVDGDDERVVGNLPQSHGREREAPVGADGDPVGP